MKKLEQIFVEKLKIFSLEEFQKFLEKVSISHESSEEDQKVYFHINWYQKPEVEELIKLHNFKNSAIEFKINLLFLYNSETLHEFMHSYLEHQSFKHPNWKNWFKPQNFLFEFPLITFKSENLDSYNAHEAILKSTTSVLCFLFGDLKLQFSNQKTYLEESIHKKNHFYVFSIEEVSNYNKTTKSLSIGVTNFENEYLLTLKSFGIRLEDALKDIQQGSWYEITFTLAKDISKLKNYDGWLTSYKSVPAPAKYLRKDIASEKINCLSLHTKFSSFDGLFYWKDFAKQVKEFEHTTLGVTDFSSVQSFAQVESCAKDLNIKPLYGCEFELFETFIHAVVNMENYQQKDQVNTYCIFDIETTGLYPLFDEVIEISIFKYKNKALIESYSSYVTTQFKLKKEIIEITNITDEKLKKEGRDPKTVLQEVKEFVGNDILVAHNGISFDLPFLNSQYIKHGLEPIKNVLIDTLLLSRAFYHEQNYKSHALSEVAKRFGIKCEPNLAHSARYDADVLANIWINFEDELLAHEFDCNKNFKEINNFLNQKGIKKKHFGDNILVYAKNQAGIKALYEIVSIAHTELFYSKPTIDKQTINRLRSDLFIASSSVNSECVNLVLKNDEKTFAKNAKFYDYIIIPPVDQFRHDINRNFFDEKQIQKALQLLVEWCFKYQIKAIFNYCAKYLWIENEEQYKSLVHAKIIGGKYHYLKSSKHSNDVMPNHALRTTEEICKSFSFLKISDSQFFELSYKNQQELISQIDEGIEIIKQKLYSPKIEGIDQKIHAVVHQSLLDTYGQNPDNYLLEKVKKELDAIITNEFTVVYWVSHLLVKKSLSDGYLVGSRGSVGSSFVAYLLNITEVNPLIPHYFCQECSFFESHETFLESGFDLPDKKCPKCHKDLNKDGHNIPFETFLGLKANKVPDIDLNFSGEYQIQAHNFLRDMFEKTHVFRSGTINTVAKKTAFALALNYLEDNQIPHNKGKIAWLSQQILDVKRTTGQHPGGILVIPKEYSIFDFTPINYPANDISSDWLTTHFEFSDLHDSIFKFDILGHDDPTFLAVLHKFTNIDPRKIKYQDPKILQLFSDISPLNVNKSEFLKETVGTIGLPEFGTLLTRKILHAYKSKTFADLIRISGISHGTNVWKNNIDKLVTEKKLCLNQVITCRDDIMIYLHSCGIDIDNSFKIMESVRKGKGIPQESLPLLQEKNIPEWYITSANKISYIFPKAHATAYVLMTLRIAYYKLYHPLEFYATYFTIHADHFDLPLLINNNTEEIYKKYQAINEEIKDSKSKAMKKTTNNKNKYLLNIYEVAIEMIERNIKFEVIDINRSQATEFMPIKDTNSILIPFVSMDGLGKTMAEQIVENRIQEGEYPDRASIEKRTIINTTLLKKMEALGIIPSKISDKQLSIMDLL